jgi:hypothetical protein
MLLKCEGREVNRGSMAIGKRNENEAIVAIKSVFTLKAKISRQSLNK